MSMAINQFPASSPLLRVDWNRCDPVTSLTFDVCALGHAIVDIVADVPDDFLQKQKIAKNSVTMVDHARISGLRKLVKKARTVRAGGAASNTVAGIASFGGKPAY